MAYHLISNLVVALLLSGGVWLGVLIRRNRLWSEAARSLWRRRPIALIVIALYLAVFYEGGLDPRLVVRRGAITGAITVFVTGLFALADVALSNLLTEFLPQVTAFSGVAAGAVTAAAIGPIHGRVRTRVDIWMDENVPVRDLAEAYLPLTATYVLVSFAAFQLDGIFIGATGTRDMRNASVLSFAVFLVASLALMPQAENLGLWLAFVLYVITRGLTLAARVPVLRERTLGAANGRAGTSP